MNLDVMRSLSVDISSISLNSKDRPDIVVKSTEKPISALVDSSTPYMILPLEICQTFEKSLGLSWDDNAGLYLINQTEYERLKSGNGNITMNIGSNGRSTALRLPVGSLILHAGIPLIAKPSRFFALKRANDSTPYTLGRVFLQNAYITADYDKRIFNVSRVIHTGDSRPFALPTGLPSIGGSSHVSSGAIVGVVLAVILLFIATYLTFAWKKKRIPFSKKITNNHLDLALKAELSGEGIPRAEADSAFEKVEAPDTQRDGELNGDMPPVELPGIEARYELAAKA